MIGKGKAVAIGASDIAMLADKLEVHPADLEAISEVESGGFGWFKDGRIKILFEKHQFYKRLDGSTRNKAVRAGLARRIWISPKNGGYKEQSNSNARYNILEKAIAYDEEAAYQSASIGRYQIMGFNYGICGFISAKHMFINFVESEAHQLRAFSNFLKGNSLVPAIRRRDFEKIETVYNGGGLNGVYAKRMERASNRLRAGKWKGYVPGLLSPTPEKIAPTPPAGSITLEKHEPVPPQPDIKPKVNARAIGLSGAIAAAFAVVATQWAAVSTWIGGLFQ